MERGTEGAGRGGRGTRSAAAAWLPCRCTAAATGPSGGSGREPGGLLLALIKRWADVGGCRAVAEEGSAPGTIEPARRPASAMLLLRVPPAAEFAAAWSHCVARASPPVAGLA